MEAKNEARNGAGTELATRPPPAAPLARFNPQDLWPRTWMETRELAKEFAKGFMVPKHLQGKEADVFYIILAGLELGVAPTVAVREFYLVDGKPSCSSLMKVGIVRSNRDVCVLWQELKSTNEECVYQAMRAGDKQATTRSFSIKDAERAGLLQKDNWRKYPAAMLRRRCQGQLSDDLFPDLVKGLASSDDDHPIESGEVRFLERVETKPPPAPAPAPSQTHTPATDVVDPKTGEVLQEAGPAAPVESLAERYLRLFEKAATVEALNAVGTELGEVRAKATKAGQPDPVSPEDHERLKASHKKLKAKLTGGTNGNA